MVSDKAPVPEGKYVITHEEYGRKCQNDLISCPTVPISATFEIKSVGNDKYSIYNIKTGKYCGSDLKCTYADANSDDRKFSFKAATGDYHKYHDGVILIPKKKFYNLKTKTGWCGRKLQGNLGRDCTNKEPKEDKAEIYGLTPI